MLVQKMASSNCSLRLGDTFRRRIWRTGQKINWGGSLCHAKEFGAYSIGQTSGFNRGRASWVCIWKALLISCVEVAQTERCLWTSVLWPLGTSAAPGDYLCLGRDEAQQAGTWKEQNWQRLAKGTSFSILHRARATCSMQIQAKRHSRWLCYLPVWFH